MFSKMEYDPILNWNCQNADPPPEEFKRKRPLRKKQRKSVVVQSLSIDDGLNKNPRKFPSLNQRLELQKSWEAKLDTENPRFITSLKYSKKQNYDRGKLPSFIEVVNSTTMEKAMMPIEFIAQQEVVIKEETNFWKLKKREEQDDIKKLTDGMSRLRIKNKIKKKKIVKLQQKLEASQRKIAILRAYNVELEAGRKL